MKKIILFGLCGVMTISASANAGWFSNLFKKSSETQTLEQACDANEIASICPETVLGNKTLIQCLSENVTSLSKNCAKYVTSTIQENKEAATSAVTEKVADVKSDVAEKKVAGSEAVKSLKSKQDTIKANAKATGKDIKNSAKAVKNEMIETGKSLKEIAK